MITFDKLKIVTNIKDITDIDTTVFVTQTKDGEILYYKYRQESPFCLIIQADFNKQELVIEFTGKILKEDYPQLSNANPILTVFDEAIRRNEVTAYHSDLKEYMMALLIKDCHNDLEEVEAKVRAMITKTVSVKKKMQPFRDLYTKMQDEVAPLIDVRSLIA